MDTVRAQYPIKVDWNPDYYLRVSLKYDYEKRTLEMSIMPRYVKEALLKFQHEWNGKSCSSPSPFTPIQYGKKMQMEKVDKSAKMNKEQVKLLQMVCGTFLYYARAVDCTMLHALNHLATKVNTGT